MQDNFIYLFFHVQDNFNLEDVLQPYKSLNYNKLSITLKKQTKKSFKQNSTYEIKSVTSKAFRIGI